METTTKEKKSLRQWWADHKPTKRRIIQVYAALLTNANLKGFGSGQIYVGNAKYACVPGLNCYSCPGAGGSCPLGALQNALNRTNAKLPYYIFGIILLYGFLFGRWICGFLCPFGLIQDLLYKVKTPKIKKNRLTRTASYLKYVILGFFVFLIPLLYLEPTPGFCKYICPSGTLLGAGGLLSNPKNVEMLSILKHLFTWKFALLVVFVVGAIFMYRFFCRFICPLGAIYSLFNKISLLGMKLNKSKCIDCGLCIGECLMDVNRVGDHECISCGRCVNVCPTNAITYKGPKILLAPNEVGAPLNTKGVKVDPCDAPGTPLPKKTKIARFVVAITMVAVLAGALVYYNFIHKDAEEIGSQTIITDEGNEITIGGEIGNQCPDYDLPLYYSDGTIKPSDTRGKVTVINFWYIHCKPCVHELKAEFPSIKETYGDDVEVIVVHAAEQYGTDVSKWINEYLPSDAGYTHCHDVKGDTFFHHLGGDQAWPLTVILDEEGFIHYRDIGGTTFAEMSEVIDKLLAD